MQRIAVLVLAVVVIGGTGWGWLDYNARVASAPGSASVPSPGPTASSTPAVPPRVLFVGDSYAAGAGASPGESWVALAARELEWDATVAAAGGTGYARSLTGELAELGCGATQCSAYPDQIEAAANGAAYDTVILTGGRNDLEQPEAAVDGVRRSIRAVEQAFPQARVLMVAPVWDDDEPPAEFIAMREAMLDAAQVAGVEIVDLGDPLLGRPQWVVDDGVHPNDKGHEVLAEKFVRAVG